MLVASVLLIAVNLRTAVTSVGPLLDDLESGIGLTSGLAGVLTTLPVITFAVLGALTPRVARRLGDKHTLVLALILMTGGLIARALVSSPWLFLVISVAALTGGAMGNVLLPVLVKTYFPNRIGSMTAGYTTALAVGTTVAAGLTVPLAALRDPADWRIGLGSWALLAAIGVLVSLLLPRAAPGAARQGEGADAGPPRISLWRNRTAWALAVFFGAQSLQAYVQFGWFALFYQERAGVSATTAGLLVALLTALSIPISMVIPSMAARRPDQRALIMFLIACTVVAYAGMLVAPRAGAIVWVVLAGIGAGAFPLALTMIGLRTRHVETTTSLSAFSQSVAYMLAAVGPLLIGVLHGVTHGWVWPFALLFADLVVMAIAGWVIGQHRYVEDELAVR